MIVDWNRVLEPRRSCRTDQHIATGTLPAAKLNTRIEETREVLMVYKAPKSSSPNH
jgi:hypothetical protein